MSKPRILLIGLDSANSELIERWSDEGHLPTFARLRKEGMWGRLGTTAEVMHVSAWPTIYTGTNPGQHGMYHAFQIRAGEQEIHRTEADACGKPPFWKLLDDAGRRCIVMDAFMDYPLKDFSGIQILEYGTWTWFGDPGSSPKSMLKDITSRFGPYPCPEHSKVVTVPDSVWFRDKLVAGALMKSKVTQWLLREHEWDMAFVTFGEPHGAGHYLWHVSDPDFPIFPKGGIAGIDHAVREVYQAVDQAIAGILEAVGDDVTVMITSGDGMGPNYSGCHLVPEMLHRMGLFYSPNVGEQTQTAKPKKGFASVLRQAIPLPVRQAITRCMPRSMQYRLNMKWVNADIDWGRSKVFCIPNSNEGYLRLNLDGREPRGNVSPGGEQQELIGRLMQEMEGLTNPSNGMRAAERVTDINHACHGPRRPDLPDISVSWDLDARILKEIEGPTAGRIRKQAGYQISPYYTGNHRANAFVLARGPGLAAGSMLDGGHILDIPASVMTMLGVQLPDYFEGTPWRELTDGSSRYATEASGA